MTFPIKVKVYHRRHTGGSKFYHAILITTADGKGAVITRYGKVTAYGAVDVQLHLNASAAQIAWQKKCREKNGRDYSVAHISGLGADADGREYTIHSISELSESAYRGTNFKKIIEGLSRDPRTTLFGVDDDVLTEDDHELVAKLDAARIEDERLAGMAAEAQRVREQKALEAKRLKQEQEDRAAAERSAAMNSSWGMF